MRHFHPKHCLRHAIEVKSIQRLLSIHAAPVKKMQVDSQHSIRRSSLRRAAGECLGLLMNAKEVIGILEVRFAVFWHLHVFV